MSSSVPMAPPLLRVVLPLGVAQTISWGSTYYLPAILAAGMAAELGVGTPAVFAAFSAALLLMAVVGPMSGRLIDLYGRRVLIASNIVFACGLALLAVSPSFAWLVVGWLLLGVGMAGGLYEAAFSTLAGIYGGEARRPITGITLIAGFASTVGWPISAWLEARYGWRSTCLVWAAIHLLLALPLNVLVPQATRGLHRAMHTEDSHRKKLPIMVALAFVFAATWFCSTAMAAHLPRLLQDAGASLALAITCAALVGPAQVAARVLEFWLMRHAHPVISARIASLAHPVGAAGLGMFGVPAAPFFTFVHGAGNGVMTIANGTLPLKYFGPGGYGMRQGMLMAPARLLQAGAPFVFDLLLSRYGVGALAMTAALGLCSFAVLMLLPGPAAAARG